MIVELCSALARDVLIDPLLHQQLLRAECGAFRSAKGALHKPPRWNLQIVCQHRSDIVVDAFMRTMAAGALHRQL